MQKETQKKSPLYFWARIDHMLREGFSNEGTTAYRIINDIIVFLIFFSIFSIMLASVEEIYNTHQRFFDISEMIVVALFTIEYIINIYVAEDKLKYVLGPWGMIDLFAVIPSYFNFIDLRAIKVLRILRILRFLRLMRMLRLLKLAKTITKTGAKSDEKVNKYDTLKMDLQIYFIALFSVVSIFSTLAYYAERGVEGTAFTSIPQAMWWCFVTITTVGYGDMYPVTVLGRINGAATMLCGLALFGLLMNVIGKYMMSSLFGTSELGEGASTEEIEKEIKKTRPPKKTNL